MGNSILGQLEALAYWLQTKYMKRRQTTEIVEQGRIRFHPHDCCRRILLEYAKRVKKYNLK